MFHFFGVLQTVCCWPLWCVFLLEALLETPPALSGNCPGMQGVGSPFEVFGKPNLSKRKL